MLQGWYKSPAKPAVTVFDLKTYVVLGKVKAAEDADGVIYDPASGKVRVGPNAADGTEMPLLRSSVFTAENQASSIGSSGILTVRVLHTKMRVLEYLPVFLVTDRISSN